jgi:hypothetical protein
LQTKVFPDLTTFWFALMQTAPALTEVDAGTNGDDSENSITAAVAIERALVVLGSNPTDSATLSPDWIQLPHIIPPGSHLFTTALGGQAV